MWENEPLHCVLCIVDLVDTTRLCSSMYKCSFMLRQPTFASESVDEELANCKDAAGCLQA